MNIQPIQKAIADKLDASPRVVWNWRDLWHARSVQINAFGAAITFAFSTAIWIAPLLGVLFEGWLPLAISVTLSGVIFTLALIARFITQKGGTPSEKPE